MKNKKLWMLGILALIIVFSVVAYSQYDFRGSEIQKYGSEIEARDHHMRKGWYSLQIGETSDAELRFKNAMSISPETPDSYIALATMGGAKESVVQKFSNLADAAEQEKTCSGMTYAPYGEEYELQSKFAQEKCRSLFGLK